MSFLLWAVVFPQSVARIKCDNLDRNMLLVSTEISVISFIIEVLHYAKPLQAWTPGVDTIIQWLGFWMNPRDPLVATLHMHILQLGRMLTGSSLNTIELTLLSHGLSAFSVYYLNSEEFQHARHETFLFVFLWGLLFSVYPAVPFIWKNLRLATMKPHHRPKNVVKLRFTYALYAYLTIAFGLLTAVRSYLMSVLHADPFFYIFYYITMSSTRIKLTVYWAFMAASGIIVVIYFWGSKPVGGLSNFPTSALRFMMHFTKSDRTEVEHDIFFENEDTLARRARALDRRRKFFHGLVVVLFLPTINRDPEYSYLALSFALTAFIFEELIRATVLPPFGVAVHKFLSGFTDHRDKSGHIVVSHLFLLIGVSAPVWLSITGESDASKGSIAMLSGVLTLGVGDAAASIIGKKYGAHKWPTLPKSIEGTAAFILAMMAGGCIVDAFDLNSAPTIDWYRFVLASLLTGLLEAVSTQNDNLIIPVYMWCLVI